MTGPHTHKRSEIFRINGHRILIHVLAYKEIDDAFFEMTVKAWTNSGGKAPRTDMEVNLETEYGI